MGAVKSKERRIGFEGLASADLILDAVYEGGASGNVGDDPLARVARVGNQGGFRYFGRVTPFSVRYCFLYSSLSDSDWPDRLDVETGRFVYFGDNKVPGGGIHDTQRGGNRILETVFEKLHAGDRRSIPPFFVFTKGANGRDVVFRGLAVPGALGIPGTEDLVAIWRTKGERRFQNYRATFTILDVGSVKRTWLDGLALDSLGAEDAPEPWRRWREGGKYEPLAAPRTRGYRTEMEQLPGRADERDLLRVIVDHFHETPRRPQGFEPVAAELFRLLDRNVRSVDVTRPWRDGGRDAIGTYEIGSPPSRVEVVFALEAKCKGPSKSNSSGVKETARLVARIKHRQFGVFVTTSCIGRQAYMELVEDDHPIVVMSGIDIVRTLKTHGYGRPDALKKWLLSFDQAI